jgi:hypothetical protein
MVSSEIGGDLNEYLVREVKRGEKKKRETGW